MTIQFYTPEGKIDPGLLDKKAQEVASRFISVQSDGGRSRVNGVSKTQMRRIFDEVKRYEKILDEKHNWDEVYPLIRMIKSKVTYTVERAKEKSRWDARYYDSLKEFVTAGIDNVKGENDYRVLCLLFEAVYGFYYGMGGAQKS